MKLLRRLIKPPARHIEMRTKGRKPPKDWHIIFQNLHYLGTDLVPGGSWRARTDLGADARGKRYYLDVIIVADEAGPTHGQVVFYQWLIRNPDDVFACIRHRVVPAWEIRTGQRFPENWRSELTLSALRIPQFGDKQRPWTITFRLKSLSGKRMVVDLDKGIAIDVAFEYLGTFQRQATQLQTMPTKKEKARATSIGRLANQV